MNMEETIKDFKKVVNISFEIPNEKDYLLELILTNIYQKAYIAGWDKAKGITYKKTTTTECQCGKTVSITVSDDHDTYTSCRNCGGEIL